MGGLTGTQLGIYFGAEFIGTLILVLIGNGVVASIALKKTKATGGTFLYASFGWFLAVFLGVMVASTIIDNAQIILPQTNKSISAGLVNPVFSIIEMIRFAVPTTGGGIPVAFGFIAIIAQFLGAAVGQLLVVVMYWNHYKVTKDESAIAGTFNTSPAIRSYWNNFTVEVIATFMLVLLAGFATSSSLKIGGPFNVGWIILGIALGLGSPTGYSLNPARDLSPRILHQLLPIPNKGKTDWSYSWIPTTGPVVGGLFGMIATPGLIF